jgi:hypothetical protein
MVRADCPSLSWKEGERQGEKKVKEGGRERKGKEAEESERQELLPCSCVIMDYSTTLSLSFLSL